MSGVTLEISDLPVEILPNIFKNLSTKDRKAVKLVCKSWFETCNRLTLTNDEVLNCLGIYQLSHIFEFLNRSKRRFLNLKFDYVYFEDDSSFWKNNASRIRSISFKDCQFYDSIEQIIVLCENLYHLSFTYTTSYSCYDPDRDSDLLPFHDFEEISRNGIVRENLNSLKIDIRTRRLANLSDDTMCHLFSAFPKLKILKIIYHDFGALNDYGTNDWDPYEGIDSYFKFQPISDFLIKSKDRIEKLKLHFPFATFSSDERNSVLGILTAMKKLTDLSINLGSALNPEDIENLIYSNKSLKSLEYTQWSSTKSVSLESCLSSPTLEHLELWVPINSSITTKTLLEKLMSSGLKSCKIVIKNGVFMQDPDSFGSSAGSRSTTLPNLSVRVHRREPRESQGELVQFLQYFQNIRHLLIDDISYNELQSLLQYQTKLKSLVLKEEGQLKSLSQDRVDIFKNAFSLLTELEHLELSYSAAYIFLRSLSPGSVLTNLRYLKISLSIYVNNMIFPTDFSKLADTSPFLEGLYVYDAGVIPFSVCVTLCTKLSRLRFLRWDRCPVNDPFCTDEMFRKLFSMCPSLRLLFYTSEYEYIYFWDIINEKVVCVLQNDDLNKPITFAKPRIGGYTVNWLTFPKKNSCENKYFF